jgi:hypothetical protein
MKMVKPKKDLQQKYQYKVTKTDRDREDWLHEGQHYQAMVYIYG